MTICETLGMKNRARTRDAALFFNPGFRFGYYFVYFKTPEISKMRSNLWTVLNCYSRHRWPLDFVPYESRTRNITRENLTHMLSFWLVDTEAVPSDTQD